MKMDHTFAWFPIWELGVYCKVWRYRHTSLHCRLHIMQIFFKTNWRFMATLGQTSYFFPIAFAHFVSLCQGLKVLEIAQTFSLLLHLLQWSPISDLWCYYNSLTAQLIISIFQQWSILKLRYAHFFQTQCHCIFNKLQDGVKVTFTRTGNLGNSCGLTSLQRSGTESTAWGVPVMV